MGKQTKTVPAAKAVTFIAFGVLVAISAMFLLGLIEVVTIFGKESYGIKEVADQVEIITKDISGYFKELGETIKWMAKSMDKGAGLADLCMNVLALIFPLVSILFFLIIALKLLFCWTPLAQAHSIGWSRACIRMCKKLKGVAGCAIAYIVYCLTTSAGMDLSTMGEVTLYLVAGYVVARVLLDSLGHDSIVRTVFRTVSTAAIAVFLVIVLKYLLNTEMPLWYMIFGYAENVIVSTQGETKNNDDMFTFILFLCSWLTVSFSIGRVTAAMKKQVTMNNGGVKASLVWLLIWTVAAAALQYIATKKYLGELSFGDWKDLEEAKYFVKSAIYGAVGLGLAIVTGILCAIGKKKESDEEDED